MEYNTHTRSPAWQPLQRLFVDNLAAFLVANGGKTYAEKHHIGAAMWNWMLNCNLVPQDIRLHADEIHFRPTKEQGGLPLWRLAYLRSIRNTPEVDAIFVGKRKGPTPRYARLAGAGLVPKSPNDFVPEPPDVSLPATLPSRQQVGTLLAKDEWVAASDGTEWVYAYTTSRELENYAIRGITPMVKVGCTRQHYSSRIAAQIRGAAVNSRPIVLLAYRTVDSQSLESAIHKALRVQGKHVADAPGVEWFEVEPEHLHQLISSICGRCVQVD